MTFEKYFDKKLKGWYWRFDVTLGGRRFRRGQFLYKKDAEDAAAALRTFAQRTAYGLPTNEPKHTLADLKAKLDADAARVRYRVRWILGLFNQLIGEQKALSEISRADIKLFADQLQTERSLTAASYAYYLNALRAGLNRAGDYFAELETWRPPKFPKAPTPSHRERIVSQTEISAVLKALNGTWKHDRPGTADLRRDIRDIVRLMLLTGARREELEKLTVFAINEETMTLNLISS